MQTSLHGGGCDIPSRLGSHTVVVRPAMKQAGPT